MYRTIELPELKFSNWYTWDLRNEFPLKKYPGVYLITVNNQNDLHNTKIKWDQVVYIGMTNSKDGLAGRWRQFNRSIQGKSGHSGGKTVFKDLGCYDSWSFFLYVSAMGIECNVISPTSEDYIRMGWVAYYEYEAFSIFNKEVGDHPKYNKQ